MEEQPEFYQSNAGRMSLDEIAEAARSCTACPLYRNATQTVFGEGSVDAPIFIIGEQPGDREDQEGKPFVGPAGKLLDRALGEAGVPREKAYITNGVKHFKFKPQGKRRIHAKPNASEIRACHPWLQAELAKVKPRILICLGATAAQAVIRKNFRLTQERGVVQECELADTVIATVHPSYLLRLRDADRDREFARFVEDLRLARLI